MDVRLSQIISESAGTYFIVTDNSEVATIAADSKLRLFFINTEKGPVNQLFKFATGNLSGFISTFGKISRMQEKRGNFSISTCLDALATGPIAVVNLRTFNENDIAQTLGLSLHANTVKEKHDVNYPELFNRNGFWVPKGKNILPFNENEQLLNFANVGNSKLSIIVTKATDVSVLTDEGDLTLSQTSIKIDEFPALDFEMLVRDTFVDVYVFANDLTTAGINTNQYYGHLFNSEGVIDVDNLFELSQIAESGYSKKYTGTLIPGITSDKGASISIDELINADYMDTGLIAHINDDVLELAEDSGVFDVFGITYHDETGAKISNNDHLLSHVVPEQLTSTSVVYPPTSIEENVEPLEMNDITFGCEKDTDTSFFGSFEQGLRIDDYIRCTNGGLVTITALEEIGTEQIPLTNFEVLRNLSSLTLVTTDRSVAIAGIFPAQSNEGFDNVASAIIDHDVDYLLTSTYPLTAGTEITVTHNAEDVYVKTLAVDTSSIKLSELTELGTVDALTEFVGVTGGTDSWTLVVSGTDNLTGLSITTIISDDDFVTTTPISASTPLSVIVPDEYTKIKYTCNGAIDFNEDEDEIHRINPFNSVGTCKPSLLNGYVVRKDQFTNGTAARQSEILDMMISPGIIKGIRGTRNLRYVVDCFKSYVEDSYKYQYGQFCYTLNESNKFMSAIINEPFIEDLEKSTNPLFKQTPNGIFDISYLADGGNKTYSSKFLKKFNTGGALCYFFGPGNIVGTVTRPLAGKVSNLFYNKSVPFDVLANDSGYIDGITELEVLFDATDRKYLEGFLWNPIISLEAGNAIFGNLTGQKAVTAQQQIHNGELLIYIKESLYTLSQGEAFKKGTYDDYLRTETETKTFMNSLALAGAIEPNPVIICSTANNTEEISSQKIKLVHVEYTPYNALEKIVFDLTIN